jgi:hypothetical protein
MDTKINKKWRSHLKGKLTHSFCGRGFFPLLFNDKVDCDLVFISEPYFMGSRGVYLNIWTLDFILENDILIVVLVWVFLPFLCIHYWNDEKSAASKIPWENILTEQSRKMEYKHVPIYVLK